MQPDRFTERPVLFCGIFGELQPAQHQPQHHQHHQQHQPHPHKLSALVPGHSPEPPRAGLALLGMPTPCPVVHRESQPLICLRDTRCPLHGIWGHSSPLQCLNAPHTHPRSIWGARGVGCAMSPSWDERKAWGQKSFLRTPSVLRGAVVDKHTW